MNSLVTKCRELAALLRAQADELDRFHKATEPTPEATARFFNMEYLTTIHIVADCCGLSKADLLGTRRTAQIVDARHMAMNLLRKNLDASPQEIALAFGRTIHGVNHALNSAESRVSSDRRFRERLGKVIEVVRKARGLANPQAA